ncbi:MAG: Asp-tRNA(Asn)/Glu-tRNA(Gln) amidotransferase subunit GatB [bacterium]
MNYEAVIGLEVHAQLLTRSKIFSASSAAFGGEPNSRVDPVCLGLPGALPVLNKRAVEFAMRMGLATHCRIAPVSVFARKNYFYPDLPRGYQISQFEEPLCENGFVEIEWPGKVKRIGITRIHLEEDAGKSVHHEAFVDQNETLVDVNRCGVPLIEIVSEPDIRSPKEAYLYLTRLKQIVQYLEICDGNMEEGSLRCDANISVRPAGQELLGVKTELKNMNSFRGVEKALEFEITRQMKILAGRGEVVQQTLLWNADRNEAVVMRSKEDSHDYRYFPDPDLVPLEIHREWVEEVRRSLPELPAARKARLMTQYGIPEYDAEVLTSARELADYYEQVVASSGGDGKVASNWVMGEVLRALKEKEQTIRDFAISAESLGALIKLTVAGTINLKTAKTVFAEMLETGRSAQEIVTQKGLGQISDADELTQQVRRVLRDNPTEVEKYRAGKKQVMGFLVGQVMRATGGKANPKLVNEILQREIAQSQQNH